MDVQATRWAPEELFGSLAVLAPGSAIHWHPRHVPGSGAGGMLPGRRRYPQELTWSPLTFSRSTGLKHPRLPSDAAPTQSPRDLSVRPPATPSPPPLHSTSHAAH